MYTSVHTKLQHTKIYTNIYAHIQLYTHTRTQIHAHTHTHTHTLTHTHSHTRTHTHTHTHTHGIHGSLLKWIESFLSDRSQLVVINSTRFWSQTMHQCRSARKRFKPLIVYNFH